MTTELNYKHLGPKPGSVYRQFFVQGPYVRAQTLYRATIGPEAASEAAVAADYGVPIEAVREAIRYCLANADLLRRENEEDRVASESYRPPLARVGRRGP